MTKRSRPMTEITSFHSAALPQNDFVFCQDFYLAFGSKAFFRDTGKKKQSLDFRRTKKNKNKNNLFVS